MKELSKILLRFISLILGIEQFESFPPPLSKDEEAEAFEKMRAGDKKAREVIIERNLRLVSHIIRKYYSSYQYPDELLSVGSYGLIKAVDSFKSGYGTRFATYGAKCVQNEILMYFRSQKRICSEVSLSDTIDVDRDGNPLTYIDVISCDESLTCEVERQIDAERAMKFVNTILDVRERKIISLRYGLSGSEPLTQREVATLLGISRSYVSRIEKCAIEKLKSAFRA